MHLYHKDYLQDTTPIDMKFSEMLPKLFFLRYLLIFDNKHKNNKTSKYSLVQMLFILFVVV